MNAESTAVLSVYADGAEDAYILSLHAMLLGASLDEGPVEVVTVEAGENRRPSFDYMVKESLQEATFIRFVKHCEHSDVILRFWRILKVLNIGANDLPISDEKTLAINDI